MKTIVNYAQKVKEQHALNKTLAPVETDLTDASRSYSIGEQFINDGDLFKAKTPIAQHDALVLDTNYEAADDITTQIKNKTVTTDPVPTEGSTNPVQSNGVYVENRNIYKVMGEMGAKALLPMSLADIKAKNTTGTWNNNAYTINGVTFTVNTDSDGFITDIAATGTASADATLMVYGYSYTSAYAVTFDTPVIASIDFVGSGSTARGIVWGTNSAYIEATEVQIAAGTLYGFGLRVLNGYEIPAGGITFKPMVRFASDSDDTYQPYVKTNKELTAENEALTNQANDMVNVLGAKNLIPYPYHRQNGYTANGATFTYDDEGVITVNKVVGNSTAYFALFSNILYPDAEKFLEPNTSYILSMELENATDTSCFVQTQNGSDLAAIRNKTTGKYEISFTTTETVDSLAVALYYGAEKTENNAKVKLMIRLASINDSTYVPYAKTNRQLTAENQTLSQDVSSQNTAIANEVETRAKLGAHNLLCSSIPTTNKNNASVVLNSDGSYTVSTSSATSGSVYLESTQSFTLDVGTYIFTDTANGETAQTTDSVGVYVTGINGSSDWFRANSYRELVVTQKSTVKFGLYIAINKTVSTPITFKPMIRLASDPSTAYAPYAMTNRELTEIIDGVSNGYVCVDFAGIVEVTADGTKTEGDLYKDLADAFLAYLGTLTPDIRIEVVELSLIATALCDGLAFYSSSSASVNIVGRGYAATSSGYSIFFALLSNTAGNNKSDYWVGSTSGNSYSDKLTTVPTSGTKRKIIFRKYKKIG